MTKKELFATVKELNNAIDNGEDWKEEILIDALCYAPSYKMYWTPHRSPRTGHWWVTID